MWILALDVGTSSIRAIGHDALGRPLPGADAGGGCEPTTIPDGGSELDPEDLVAATASAIDRCLAAASGPPAAVGASVFWHNLPALDAGGRPLIGVITWADTRSAGAAKALRARVDARRHLIGGATSEGGNVLAWARRTLPLPGEDAALDTTLAAVSPDSHGLTALPFLAGERSPGWRGSAHAALLALGPLGRQAPPPEPSGTPMHPHPRRRDIYAAARARQGHLYDSVVGPRVS